MTEKTQPKKEKSFLKYNSKILADNKNLFLKIFAGSLIIYSFLYGMWRIPFIDFGVFRTSGVGFGDYLFILAISALVSFFIILWKEERKQRIHSNTTIGATGGGIAAIVAGICPACQSIAIVALGSTFLNIPTNALAPYLTIIKTLSLGLLLLATYLKADSIYTKKCKMCFVPQKKNKKKKEPLIYRNKYFFGAVSLLVVLLFVNQLMIPAAFASTQSFNGGTTNLGSFEYGSKITLKPMPLATDEQPKIAGYGAIVKPLPTISELSITPSTGDAVQDLLNNLIPKGTPWYGSEAGVTFDDPVMSQKRWKTYKTLSLSSTEQERWNRIANSFTCDYCCGSPQRPTIITRCGCAHAHAAQGMAAWFIKNYGNEYSDEEIYGEMARWYSLWYPKGTIERIILESQ